MVARVRLTDEACPRFGKNTAPVKSKDYVSWLHNLPCIVSGGWPVEAAHLSEPNEKYGHTGRGKGRKASDRWVLPLTEQIHRQQHQGNEMAFWERHGINPHEACLVLWGLFNERGDDAIPQAQMLIQSGALKEPVSTGEPV
jgi:hypothetical protein